jgi:hypothetical protein
MEALDEMKKVSLKAKPLVGDKINIWLPSFLEEINWVSLRAKSLVGDKVK